VPIPVSQVRPATVSGLPCMDALEMSRLSIYAGQQGALSEFRKRAPLALAAAYRAPDGHIGIALASTSDAPLEVAVHLDATEYGLSGGCRLWRLDDDDRRPLGHYRSLPAALPVPLAPREAVVLEIEREG